MRSRMKRWMKGRLSRWGNRPAGTAVGAHVCTPTTTPALWRRLHVDLKLDASDRCLS